MGLEAQYWRCCLGLARRVVECAVRSLHELVTNHEFLVRKSGWLPDGEASWISVPFVVRLGDIAKVIQLVGRIVCVYIRGVTFKGSLECVATVFNPPKPGRWLARPFSANYDVHIVGIEGYADLIPQSVAH
jgi:hypothetical protein